jgi:hypothetical protein
MTDATKPLGPLDPTLVDHLTQKLGPPESFLLAISAGGLDIRAVGWKVGFGSIEAGGTARDMKRGTDVTIRLMVGGQLLTSRCSWTKGPTSSEESQTGRVNSTPQAAWEWLLEDGGGKLGRASKDAWVKACRTVPPMADLEFEQVI